MTYQELDQRLQGVCFWRRKLANNTYAIRYVSGRLGIRLHETDILTYCPDGRVRLDSGGSRTATTKDRLNTYGPIYIYQICGSWYVHVGVDFYDGMIIQNGRLVEPPTPDTTLTLRTRRTRLLAALYQGIQDTVQPGAPRAYMRNVLYEDIQEDKLGHYLAYSHDNPKMVSYAPKQEWREDDGHRTKTTLGRYLRKQMGVTPEQVSDRCLEKLGYAVFGAAVNGNGHTQEVKLITGDAVRTAYAAGVGAHSCMTGDQAPLTQLYADNPNRVAMAVLEGNRGRALIWQTDQGTRVMDRIYPNEGRATLALQAWADSQAIPYRENQALGWVRLRNDGKYTVTLDKLPDNNRWPYMDTFCWAAPDAKGCTVLTNDHTKGWKGAGQTEHDYHCYNCDLGITEDNTSIVGGEAYCDTCHSDLFTPCDRCQGSVHNGSLRDVGDNQWCERCYERYACSCDRCGVVVTSEDTEDVEGGTWCQSCYEEYATPCDKCSAAVSMDSTIQVGEESWCSTCSEGYADRCGQCGELVNKEELTPNEQVYQEQEQEQGAELQHQPANGATVEAMEICQTCHHANTHPQPDPNQGQFAIA